MSTRIKQVQVFSGYTTIMLTIDETDNGFVVSAVSVYRTYQGGRVGGVKEWTFPTVEAAKEKANGYYAFLVRKGWERVTATL